MRSSKPFSIDTMRTKFIAALLLLSSSSFSQNVPTDVSALWSQTGVSGTARTVGSAGAYGSVGADMGCITINPAGLGLYRTTDFAITPLLQIGSSQSVYNGSNTFAHKLSPGLAQGGFVFTKLYKKPADKNEMGFTSSPIRSFSFALNFQQQNIFNRSQQYAANNTTQSMIDGYASQLNGAGPSMAYLIPPEVQIAQYANLIGQNSNGSYYSNFKAPVTQQGDIETRGSVNRIDAAFGLNFLDKVYFGIDLAVPILGYSLSNDFSETAVNSNPIGITGYSLSTVITETGYGFNGIIGLIYRPLPWMRIGAAYHLPTWYTIHEGYSIALADDSATYSTPDGGLAPFQYGLRTPMKGDFSASFYYKQYGFISIDYDMQNLGASRIHIPNDSLQVEPYYNQQIAGTFKLTHTIHAGLEAAIKIVRLRAGYAFSTSPYKNGQQYIPMSAGYNDVKNAFTMGIGVRLTHFYADLAYVYAWSKDGSYQLTNTLPVNNRNYTSTLLLTLGWKFDAGAKNTTQQKTEQRKYTPPPPPVDDQRY
jgi:hypothetical protein